MGKPVSRLYAAHRSIKEMRMPDSEKRAIEKTKKEAENVGATIKNLYGGLPASLALGIFRRDEYKCKKCGGMDNIGIHHKGGEQKSRHAWKGKLNSFDNLVVVCGSCHSAIHEEDNANLHD